MIEALATAASTTAPPTKKKPDFRGLVEQAVRRLKQPDRVTVQAWLRGRAGQDGAIDDRTYLIALKAMQHPTGIAAMRGENQKAIWKKQDETAERLEAISTYMPWAKTAHDVYLQKVDPSKLKAPDLQKKYGAINSEAQRLRKELAKKVPDYVESNAEYEAWKRQRAKDDLRHKELITQAASLKTQLGRHGVSRADGRKRREGTLEQAMSQVDRIFRGNISPQKRETIKAFLRRHGGWNRVDTDLLRTALGLAYEGRYGYLKAWSDPQKAVTNLGFDLREYSKAKRNKERFVPTLDREGRLTIAMAEAQMKRHLGLSEGEIKTKKPYGEFFKATTTPYVDAPEDRLTPWQEKIASMMPDDGLAGVLKTPSIAFQLIPDALQDVAGQAMGLDPGQVFTIPEIQESGLTKFGKKGFELGKYFIPGVGQVALGSDLTAIGGRATEVGLGQASAEAWKGVVDSVNVFEPGLDWGERFGRALNAGFLAYGISKGAAKAYRGGEVLLAAKELSKRGGMTIPQAIKTLKGLEQTIAKNLKALEARTKGLKKGAVGAATNGVRRGDQKALVDLSDVATIKGLEAPYRTKGGSGKLREEAVKDLYKYQGSHTNEDTKWQLFVSGMTRKHSVSGTMTPARCDAIHNLPEILRTAKLKVSRPDKHGSPDLAGVHEMYAKVNLTGRVATVKLTVKEYRVPDPHDGSTHKLYHVDVIEVQADGQG
jgi:hypothetical protein